MELSELLNGARDALSAKRVFGDPYEKDGVTIITVAKVSGGGGGGSGGDVSGGQGMGGGFGMSAAPVGAYVIKDGKVSWMPAVDVNRVILGGQLVAIFMLLTFRGFMRHRMRERMIERIAAKRRSGKARRS